MESESGEDGECVGIRCAIDQDGRCGVRTQGHDNNSRAGGVDGAVVQGHGTSLPGTA